ncbi:FtsW/RodA/SpoVE family cell cycle protein [Actinophytocola sp.]|uniref:FtsW/RodA/SpoVE family cell cycle protein n=1 Tax=Actinophytocola sp. TaxID=1872138 RepID=UPI002D41BC7A|nr:FtsW/RodA/SpoVE family cell cycle protein [Actinophytocola sp.]HYQ69005.1 FtsW/RodA/SpoVE family cell cycle protein [Actinophytocola sp.]
MAQPGSGLPAGQSGDAQGTTAPTRRGTELSMLAFAAGLVTAALMLVEANQDEKLSLRILWYGMAYLALFAIAHIAVRKLAPYADPLILPCVALLNGIGLVMIYRIDLAKTEAALQSNQEWENAVPKQILWTTIALILFLVVLYVIKDHRTLTRYAYTFGLVGLFLLALPAVLPSVVAPTINGAKIWLRLPGVSIQPGEFAKILLLIFFAAFLVSKRDLFIAAGRRVLGVDLPRARDLGPILFCWGVSVMVLVAEKDLGTSLLFFGTVLVMLYVATERGIWIGVGLALFVGGCLVAYQLFSHVRVRVATWLDPFADYNNTGYQLAQALFGLGTGGVGGTGLGAGRPDIVPYANSDFITAAIGEELGFIGLAAVLMVYMLLAMRGLRSAVAVRDTFGKLLGGGLSFALIMQVFVVVGGVTKLIPLTGITAPFLSAGGSSLLANYVLVALLLRISDAARRPQTGQKLKPANQVPIAEAGTVMVERPQ